MSKAICAGSVCKALSYRSEGHVFISPHCQAGLIKTLSKVKVQLSCISQMYWIMCYFILNVILYHFTVKRKTVVYCTFIMLCWQPRIFITQKSLFLVKFLDRKVLVNNPAKAPCINMQKNIKLLLSSLETIKELKMHFRR